MCNVSTVTLQKSKLQYWMSGLYKKTGIRGQFTSIKILSCLSLVHSLFLLHSILLEEIFTIAVFRETIKSICTCNLTIKKKNEIVIFNQQIYTAALPKYYLVYCVGWFIGYRMKRHISWYYSIFSPTSEIVWLTHIPSL